MAWGEIHQPAAAVPSERTAADALARAVGDFREKGTTGNIDRMFQALEHYRDARYGTVPR